MNTYGMVTKNMVWWNTEGDKKIEQASRLDFLWMQGGALNEKSRKHVTLFNARKGNIFATHECWSQYHELQFQTSMSNVMLAAVLGTFDGINNKDKIMFTKRNQTRPKYFFPARVRVCSIRGSNQWTDDDNQDMTSQLFSNFVQH